MQEIQTRSTKLEAEFSQTTDWEKKYEMIIQKGKNLPELPESMRLEKNLVKGCQSQVWLFAEKKPDGRVHFFADSDALIVKGLIAVLMDLFQDLDTASIVQADLEVFKRIGLNQHLSPSRSNGLQAMVKQMKLYAYVFQQMKN
jgi:cysteine desulfuration protein SufE